MRLGIVLIPTDPWQRTLARALALESLGFHHLWTYDHLSWQRYRDRPWHAAIPWLAGIAARTSRIRLGTMVASPNFRHPVLLAKDAMTLDHVSGGRLTLGVGAGGIGYDATVFGEPVPNPGERARRLGDFLEIVGGSATSSRSSTACCGITSTRRTTPATRSTRRACCRVASSGRGCRSPSRQPARRRSPWPPGTATPG